MTDQPDQEDRTDMTPGAESPPVQPAATGGPAPQAISVEDLQAQLPPENLELLSAVLEISRAPATDRTRLYHALMGGVYLVPVVKLPTSPADGQPGAEVNVDVVTFAATDGQMVLPAFTHAGALQLWTQEEQPTITLQGLALFQLSAPTAIATIVVNPAGPFGGQVSEPEIEALARGVIPVAPPAPAVPAGPPNVYIDLPLVPIPAGTAARVQEILESNAAVVTAHLFLMQVGDAQAPVLTLGIHAEGAAAQWVIPQLTRALRQESLSFEPYDTPRLFSLDSEPGADQIRKSVPAFFARADVAGSGDIITTAEFADSEDEDIDADDETTDETGYELEDETGDETEDKTDDNVDTGARPRRSLWPFRRRG